MIKIKKILFPTDFSQNANAARPYACNFAEQNGAELHVLHVLPAPDFLVPSPDYLLSQSETWEALRRSADKSLTEAIEPEWRQKLKVVQAVRKGAFFLEILRYAREHTIDLIVMSTHGRTGLKHLIMGSVAENVVRKSPCPVLTIHPADHAFVAF